MVGYAFLMIGIMKDQFRLVTEAMSMCMTEAMFMCMSPCDRKVANCNPDKIRQTI